MSTSPAIDSYTAVTVPTQFVEGSVLLTAVGADRPAFRSSSINTSAAISIIGTPPFSMAWRKTAKWLSSTMRA